MCFSAEASFTAAACLAGIGLVSVRRALPRRRAFAAIPWIFAAQQAVEGLVWRTVAVAPWGRSDTALGRAFLFFALFVWPSYLPFSLALAETDPRRARGLWAAFAAGTAVGGYLFACATLRPSYVCIAFSNLYYGVQVDGAIKPVYPLVYLASVVAPLLLTSLRGGRALGALLVAAFSVAATLFRVGFASVWCFFAAVLSGVVAIVGSTRPLPTLRSAP